MIKKTLLAIALLSSVLTSCTKDYTSKDYLKKVLTNLESIETASFSVTSQAWNPGDTAAVYTVNEYVESYRNPQDTALGTSWAVFEDDGKTHLEFAYDGNMRTLIYDDVKGMVIDSFKVRKLPFRPVSPPFFNYVESILEYILTNKDSTSLELEDLSDEVYLKLTVYEEEQIEFFGKAHYMPKNPYTYDPISVYELWIDKQTDLPKKVRREMCHSISAQTVNDYEFNNLDLSDFTASDYFPKDYEIRQYGEKKKKRNPNALIGKQAPDWTLINDSNQNCSLADFKGKVLMIQFTSIGCGPCKASIPFLKSLETTYSEDECNIVAIECSSKSTEGLKSYKTRNNFDYELLLSTKDVRENYSIRAFPVFFVLDENRKIIEVLNGYSKGKSDKKIKDVINRLK